MADKEKAAAFAAVVAIIISRRHRRRKKRSVWVRDWIKVREERGAYHQLVQELRLTDISSYRNFLRMDHATFAELLQKVTPLIKCEDTVLRTAIDPGERLALTLRYLATDEDREMEVSMLSSSTLNRGKLHKFAVSLSNTSTNNWEDCSRYL